MIDIHFALFASVLETKPWGSRLVTLRRFSLQHSPLIGPTCKAMVESQWPLQKECRGKRLQVKQLYAYLGRIVLYTLPS